MKKGFVIIPILIVVLLIGVVLIFILKNNTTVQKKTSTATPPTPTTSQMLDWKTFSNERYGYTIDYLPNFEVDANAETTSVFFNSEEKIPTHSGQIPTTVVSIFTIEDTTLEAEKKLLETPLVKISKLESIQVNGKVAIRVETTIGAITTIVESDGNVYMIALISANVDQETLSMYEQMVSSLEFTQ